MINPTCETVYGAINLVVNISGKNYFNIDDVCKIFSLYFPINTVSETIRQKIKLLLKLEFIEQNENNLYYVKNKDGSTLSIIDKIYFNTKFSNRSLIKYSKR